MTQETIIGIVLIALSIHLIVNREWIVRKQAESAKKRGGFTQKAFEGRSPEDHNTMARISGPLVLVLGLFVLFSSHLNNS